jgi:hypothetical protein
MRAVVYRQFGPSSVLEVREIDEPHPGDGQVRIRVGASSVNPIDGKVRAGFLAKVIPVHFPAQAGFDAAGIVDEVGVGVDGVTTGDRLFGMTAGGGAAEFAVLQAWAPTPPNTPDTVAAAAALAGITAVKAEAAPTPTAHHDEVGPAAAWTSTPPISSPRSSRAPHGQANYVPTGSRRPPSCGQEEPRRRFSTACDGDAARPPLVRCHIRSAEQGAGFIDVVGAGPVFEVFDQ